MMRRLPVFVGGPPGRLLARERSAVWPVTPDELRVLQQTAQLFGFDLEVVDEADELDETDELERTQGTVLAMDPPSVPWARLYAHLTRRAWKVVEREEELAATDGFDVVVALRATFGSDLLDTLSDPRRTTVPGLVYASSPAALRLQVLVRSAVVRLGCSAPCRTSELFPVLDLGRRETATGLALGARASLEELEAAMSDGNAIVVAFTHSDGLDADLGPHVVLCPADEAWEAETALRTPPCRTTRHCHRLGLPLAEAAGSGRLLHPRHVAARIFVFNSCVGIMPADLNIDAAYGIGVRLVGNHRIGALVTSWRPALTTPSDTALLTRLLLQGVPLGRALARHNAWHESSGSGHRLCLVGDPLLTASAGEPVLPRPAPAASPDPSPSSFHGGPSSALAELELVRACFGSRDHARVGSTPNLASMQDRVDRALVLVDELELRGEDAALGPEGDEMRAAVTEVLANRGRFCDLWLRHATACRLTARPRPCRGCTNSSVRYELRLGALDVEPRVLELCPRCGFTRDHPVGQDALLHVDAAGRARLEHEPLEGMRWSGRLTIQYRRPYPTKTWPWPSGADGSPVTVLDLPEPLEPVPVWVTVSLVVGTRIIVASRSLRGLRSP